MPSLTVSSLSQSLILLVLSQRSYAQDSSQCAAIASQVQYNASSTLTIPALSLSYLGSDPSNVLIRNETSFSWTLSSYIQPRDNGANSNPNITETVVWLDTAESDAERLGETMRMCHNFVSLQTGPNLTWSHDVLEKSVGDTGDCRSMVSEACLQALERQYTNNAASERSEYSRCTDTNTTVPWECAGSGMVAPISRPNPPFNSSLASHFPLLSNSSTSELNTTDPLVCNGRNFSRSFGTRATVQDYDVGTNFPLMDIMTFFPTAEPGSTFRADMQRVQIACLVPGQVSEGSRAKANVQSVLDRYNTMSGNQTAGAAASGSVEVWKLAAWTLGVGLICVT